MSNIIYNTAKDLYEQMQLVKKCNEGDLKTESERLVNMAAAAEKIALFAKGQVDMFIQTGTLPEHNLLFSSDEKIITGGGIEKRPKQLKGSVLIDEFNRGIITDKGETT